MALAYKTTSPRRNVLPSSKDSSSTKHLPAYVSIEQQHPRGRILSAGKSFLIGPSIVSNNSGRSTKIWTWRSTFAIAFTIMWNIASASTSYPISRVLKVIFVTSFNTFLMILINWILRMNHLIWVVTLPTTLLLLKQNQLMLLRLLL